VRNLPSFQPVVSFRAQKCVRGGLQIEERKTKTSPRGQCHFHVRKDFVFWVQGGCLVLCELLWLPIAFWQGGLVLLEGLGIHSRGAVRC